MYTIKKYLTWLPVILLIAGAATVARGNDHNDSKAVAYRAGYNYGYGIGYGDGQNDFRKGEAYHLDSHDYKDRDKGYSRSIGHKDDYENGYQAGFRTGYQDGYGGRAFALYTPTSPAGVSPVYIIEQPAYPSGAAAVTVPAPAPVASGNAFIAGAEIGYDRGLQQGMADLRTNQTYDPARHSDYLNAIGYNASYGSKDDFDSGYRQGFEDGYRTAFGHH